jgi:uncharacterized RDD family membrane protein YckC
MLVPLLCAAARAQDLPADPALAREATADHALDFPHPRGLTLFSAPGATADFMFVRDDGSSLGVTRLDIGGDPGRLLSPDDAGPVLAKGLRNAGPGCAAGPAERGTLDNGWPALMEEGRCSGGKVPRGVASLLVLVVDGRAYMVSGVGFTLAQTRAFAGQGRVVPAAQRPTSAQLDAQRQGYQSFARTLDQLNGGPQKRALARTLAVRFGLAALLLLGVGAWRLAAGPGTEPEPAAEPAGFWVRGGAFWIDALVLLAGVGFLVFLLPDGAPGAARVALGFAVSGVYQTWLIARRGQTPGKMAAGVKVTRPDGGPVDAGRAFVRFLVRDLTGLIPLGYAAAALGARKVAAHDFAAGTRVVFLPGIGKGRRRALAAVGALGVAGLIGGFLVLLWMLWILAHA